MAVKSGLLFATINPLFAKIKLLMAINDITPAMKVH
jgi:hypothetical protein